MSVYATKTTQACAVPACGRQLRDKYGAVVTHYDAFDISATVDEQAQLTIAVERESCQSTTKVRGDNVLGRQTSPVQFLQTSYVAGAKSGSIAIDSSD
jgi:hypothetical protein